MPGVDGNCRGRRRFVVLDRDGTIIEERHYLSTPSEVQLIPGAAEGLRKMAAMGLGLVVLTNQSGVGRGMFDQARLDLIHQRLGQLLEAEGVRLDGILFCPHTPADNCRCRKPETGMLELAAGRFNFEPGASFVIGDKASDIELGRRAGATTLLVSTGYGAQVAEDGDSFPDHLVKGLPEAASVIQEMLNYDSQDLKIEAQY